MLDSGIIAAIVLSVVSAVLLFALLVLLQCLCGVRTGEHPDESGESVVYKPNHLFQHTANKSHIVVMELESSQKQQSNPQRPSSEANPLAALDAPEIRPTAINFETSSTSSYDSCRTGADSPKHAKENKSKRNASVSNDQYDLENPYLHPECGGEGLYDWGPGIASCARCKRRPIFNRGCRACDKRMCPPCFAAHREERINVLELSHVVLRSYGGVGSTAIDNDAWGLLAGDIQMYFSRRKGRDRDHAAEISSIMAKNTPDAGSPVTLTELVQLWLKFPVLIPVIVKTFRKNKDFGLVQERGMAVPECSLEAEMHDWGPGLTTCQMCATRTLNRGCRNCNKKLCEKCFNFHRQLAKLANEAMSGKLLGSKEIKEMEQQESNQLSCAQKCTQGTPEGASFPGCDTTQPQPPGMRHLPPDFAANCPAKAPKHHQARVVDGVEFLLDDANLAHLRGGGALYSCSCKEGSVMTDLQLRMAASFVNISSFDDELKENCVPYVDPLSDDAKSYVYLLNKAMYLMPKKVRSEDLNSKVFSSVDFHKNCQPGKPKVWTDVQEHHTFRLTKTVIPILFSVTFQLKCSAVPKEHYASLAVLCDNLPVHHAMLMERTKRTAAAQDSTLKLKSILCYHFLPQGGMVVTNVTAAVNSSVPLVIARVVDKLSSMGAAEVYETAEKTRGYLCRLSDQRNCPQS